MIKYEQTTAKNIKNNTNRKSVCDALTRVSTFIQTIKSIPSNGIALFSSQEDHIVIYPPRALNRFIYRCGKTFAYEELLPLFEEPKKMFGILQVWGEETIIQIANEFCEVKNIATKTTKIQKRQKNGGQSQNRIARLREESIHNYLKLSGEKANNAFMRDGLPIIEALLIVGNGWKKDMLEQYLIIPKNISRYVYSVEKGVNIESYIKDMILKETGQEEKKHLTHIQDAILFNPDILVFGRENVLKEENLKYIYVSDKINLDKKLFQSLIILKSGLEPYGGIVGERFFKTENEYNDGYEED
jgi:hypothetical protein